MSDELKELVFSLKIDGAKQAQDILDSVNKKLGESEKQAKQTDKAVGGFGASLKNLVSADLIARGITSIASSLFELGKSLGMSIIEEAADAEETILQLDSALARAGLTATSTKQDIMTLADEMAASTRYTDDEIKRYSAFAITLGASSEELKKVIPLAADFAVATGKDMREAVSAFTKSLAGNGRALAALYPDLKEFTAEELKAGAALDFFQKKLGGASLTEMNTFNGQLHQMKKLFNDIFETIGLPITTYLGPLFRDFNTFLRQNTGSEFFTGIGEAIKNQLERAAVYVYDFYLFLKGGKSWLGKQLGMDGNEGFAEKLTASFVKLTASLTEKMGELFIPVGIAASKGFISGFANYLGSTKFGSLIDTIFGAGVSTESASKALESARQNMIDKQKETGSFNSWPSPVGVPPKAFGPENNPAASSDSTEKKTSYILNQDVKIFSNGETAEALARQLRAAKYSFSSNVVA